MKVHLYRSSRSTWCGLKIADHPNLMVIRGISLADLHADRCKTCIKADRAEQAKEDAANGAS